MSRPICVLALVLLLGCSISGPVYGSSFGDLAPQSWWKGLIDGLTILFGPSGPDYDPVGKDEAEPGPSGEFHHDPVMLSGAHGPDYDPWGREATEPPGQDQTSSESERDPIGE